MKKINKKVIHLLTYSFIFTIFSIPVFASGNWGQNAQRWFVIQATAVACIFAGLAIIYEIVKKQWAGLIGTIIIASICIFFISQPNKLQEIGAFLFRTIFG